MLASPSQTPESALDKGPSPPTDPAPKITRGHSCVLCQQRKVRCDRQKPCSNCVKARAECVASPPSLPRRRRRKLAEIDVTAKLRKYEQLLKKHGVKLDEEDDTPPGEVAVEVEAEEKGYSPRNTCHRQILNMTVPRASNTEPGALFTVKGDSHYVENTLWENLRDEIQDQSESLQVSSASDDETNEANVYLNAEELMVSHGQAPKILTSLHPPPVQIFMLWQTFLGNVNPLVKIFHAHTVQQTILDASGDLEKVSRSTEALMFSIYLIAVTSLSNEECESMFRESRTALINKYSQATQQALINSKFLKSLNMTTLQALTLYLLGVRKLYDHNSFWIITGVAVRIAHRLGLHRDGSHYKMSVFDIEMRRRTWWQIVFLDGHASKLAGAGFPSWLAKFDTKSPLNISDSDLTPLMKEPPVEKEGATEMIFCCLRYDVAQAARSLSYRLNGNNSGGIPFGTEFMAAKDKAIDELEAQFQEKYLRFCDPSIPLHLMVIYTAKSVLCIMRIMAHHPRQYPDKGASMPQSERDMLFIESVKELEIDSKGHNVPAVKGFLWLSEHHFQLDAFIYLISELRYRLTGEMVEKAWQEVQASYEYHGSLLNDTKNSLSVAIGNLTLKAWRKREEAGLVGQGSSPHFITVLRTQRGCLSLPHKLDDNSNDNLLSKTSRPWGCVTSPGNQPEYQANMTQFDPNLTLDVTMPEITPVEWEYWQTLMDGDLPAYNNSDGQFFFN